MEQLQKQPRYRCLSAAVLKWIAIITMLIDHFGAAFLGEASYVRGWGSGIFSFEFYELCRIIGRLAFPIFCFLLVEGLVHTRSRWKYLLRLAVFALLSEHPFDRAFFQSWWTMDHQNVFFTLLFGLAACAAWEWLTAGNSPDCNPLRGFVAVLAAAAAFYAAEWLHTDYGGLGVLLIIVLYLLRDKPAARDLIAFCVLYELSKESWEWEIVAAVSFVFFHLYNGQRGRQPKYFFYVFYPAHLLLLYGLLLLVIQ